MVLVQLVETLLTELPLLQIVHAYQAILKINHLSIAKNAQLNANHAKMMVLLVKLVQKIEILIIIAHVIWDIMKTLKIITNAPYVQKAVKNALVPHLVNPVLIKIIDRVLKTCVNAKMDIYCKIIVV